MSYNSLTLKYFDEAPQAGSLAGRSVSRGVAGERRLGTWVRFELQSARGQIRAATFAAYGCPHVVAISAWVAEQAIGRPLPAQSLPEPVNAIRRRFDVPATKLGSLLVIEDAWTAATLALNHAEGHRIDSE
jgi:NifU-like protein involved in Fe-S cluster formation